MHNKQEFKENFIHKYLPSISVAICLLCGLAFIIEFHHYNQMKKDLDSISSEKTPKNQIEWYDTETTSEILEKDNDTSNSQNVSETDLQVVESKENTTFEKVGKQDEEVYVMNKKSKKIHKASCRYAQNMKTENKVVLSKEELNQLDPSQYSYCKVCFKEEDYS